MPLSNQLNPTTLLKLLPPRPKDASKANFGHVLVIGGNLGMAGAVRLAGEAALRVGAGLVSVATRPEHVSAIVAERPELMARGIVNVADIEPLLAKATVIAVGPGLGQDAWAKDLWQQALASHLPKVIDADALNLLAINPAQKLEKAILTPHPGEAARLLGSTPAEIQADRIKAVQSLHQKYHSIAILKGAGTLIQLTNQPTPYLCTAGNPGMASGGMGDVLTGVIAGLIAQKLSLEDAAQLGVWLHAQAGDHAAKTAGERGLLATDLFQELHKLVNRS